MVAQQDRAHPQQVAQQELGQVLVVLVEQQAHQAARAVLVQLYFLAAAVVVRAMVQPRQLVVLVGCTVVAVVAARLLPSLLVV